MPSYLLLLIVEKMKRETLRLPKHQVQRQAKHLIYQYSLSIKETR
jgi:hypothetical protein